MNRRITFRLDKELEDGVKESIKININRFKQI